ncbi:putative ribonuclease H-like domain-containing protein [Tanacetum coccineum]
MPRECLKIIESKSKVRQSRSKAIVSKVSTSSSTPAVSSDVAELKDMVKALILNKKNQTPAPAPVKAVEQRNQTNKNAGPQEANGDTGLKKSVDARQSEEKNVPTQQYIVFPLWSSISSSYKSSDETYKNDIADDAASETPIQKPESENEQTLKNVLDKMMDQEKEATKQSDDVIKEFGAQCNRQNLPGKTTRASNTNNFNTVSTPVTTAGAPRTSNDVGPSFVSLGGSFPLDVNDFPDEPLMPNLEDTAEEPTKIAQALDDESWVEAMQEELLQFKIQKVWTLVDLPYDKKAIGTKWVYRNKKDERGIVVRNIARLMDVKSAFLYGTIEEEVYVSQPLGFVDPEFPEKVYMVEKALYGLHQAPRAWYETLSTYLLDNGFYRVKQKEDGIFISQDKYVGEILKKFGFSSIRTANIPIETNKALTKDEDGASLDKEIHNRGCQFLGSSSISWQCTTTVVANSTTEAEYIAASHYCGQVLWIQNQMLDYGYNFMQTKIHVDNESAICGRLIVFKCSGVYTSAIWIEVGSVERTITTDASLVAGHDNDNIIRTQTTAMPNVDLPLGMDTGGSPKRQETIGVLLLRLGGYTPRSDNGRLKLEELMAMCIKLSKQVLDLEKENDDQAVEILKLKKRVKKLERQRKSSISHPRRRIYRQVKSSDDDLDEEDASKQGRTSDKTKPMFKDSDFDDLDDLVDKGMDFIQEKDAENQGKIGADNTVAKNPPTYIEIHYLH